MPGIKASFLHEVDILAGYFEIAAECPVLSKQPASYHLPAIYDIADKNIYEFFKALFISKSKDADIVPVDVLFLLNQMLNYSTILDYDIFRLLRKYNLLK